VGAPMFIGNGFQVLYTSLEPISNSRRAEILHCPLHAGSSNAMHDTTKRKSPKPCHPLSGSLTFFIRQRHNCNRNRLIETLKQQNVTAEDEMLIRGVTKTFPAIALGLIELALPTVRKDFPALNSGRPKSLTSEEERAACEYIGKLHVEGLEMKIAKQRAAQKFNVSVPTINRTWAEREKGHIPSAKEILEIFKAKQANTAKALPVSDEKSSENATRTSFLKGQQ
jgi:hypothetical protein